MEKYDLTNYKADFKENNKFIAKFMNVELTGIGKYHESWDWLMPVIKKIDDLIYKPNERIEKALCWQSRYIGYTYDAVLAFLNEYDWEKWYEDPESLGY